jgi:hypothetical protein
MKVSFKATDNRLKFIQSVLNQMLPDYCGSEVSYPIPPLNTNLSLTLVQLQCNTVSFFFYSFFSLILSLFAVVIRHGDRLPLNHPCWEGEMSWNCSLNAQVSLFLSLHATGHFICELFSISSDWNEFVRNDKELIQNLLFASIRRSILMDAMFILEIALKVFVLQLANHFIVRCDNFFSLNL